VQVDLGHFVLGICHFSKLFWNSDYRQWFRQNEKKKKSTGGAVIVVVSLGVFLNEALPPRRQSHWSGLCVL